MTTLDKTSILAQLAALKQQEEELKKQEAAYNEQLRLLKQAEKAEIVAKVKALVAEHGLTADDLFFSAPAPNKGKARKSTGPVPAKYRNTETGDEWSGRGLAPKWMVGDDKNDRSVLDANKIKFAIKE